MKLQPREYQQKIIESIQAKGNTLVVLPTGLGKTLIALALMEKTKGKSIFLTPTKPLARQHSNTILDVLGKVEGGSVLVTGELPQKKRAFLYENRMISSTPQTIRNDLKKGLLKPEDISLIVFDEAHRAVGDYAYVKIAEKLTSSTKIIGLTASPGGNKAKIQEVLRNIKATNIEIRTQSDPDVSPYIKKMGYKWIPVDITGEYGEAKQTISMYVQKQAQFLRTMGIRPQLFSKTAFLALRPKIMKIKHPMKYRLIYLYSCLLHGLHLQELLETQGKAPFFKYLEKLSHSEAKSARAVVASQEITKVSSLLHNTPDHPKMKALFSIMDGLGKKKAIVFVQYRDQITEIVSELKRQGHKARPFMGKKKEFTRQLQEETMDSFRKGEFDVLVASSIGEEGLDIPEVDAVIFYEPIASEIRSIQRRGRAGRLKEGEVYVLMARNTKDEWYYWASIKREKKMKELLLEFQEKFRNGKPFSSEKFAPTHEGKRGIENNAQQLKKQNKEPPKEGQNQLTDFF